MVKFRRSLKTEKNEAAPRHISIPPKDAIAIVPPKKVIKALHDWTPDDPNPSSGFLGFSQGDFLHVVGRENETDWYEACNPLKGTRGLVPVGFFEPVGKTVRDSAGSSATSATLIGHDSGYAEQTAPLSGSHSGPHSAAHSSAHSSTTAVDASAAAKTKELRLSKTLGKGNGAMVFGVVMYDFEAERPDELEAKQGEAIIIIAQSNPEWFVAKPITRLGGPGLIPVSFIEIRDMTSGKAVANPLEAVQRAGVPKVEEWKKMAAEYKNGSIPLGKLDAQLGMMQGMERLSVGKSPTQNGFKSPIHSPFSNPNQAPQPGQQHQQHQQQQQQQPHQQQQQQQYRHSNPLIAPIKALVPRYIFKDELFFFIVECQMEDGRYWELSRVYQDFYDLQIALIQEFPAEAGNVSGVERSLPYMPGPVTYVTDNISNGRRANLDDYLKNLLKLGTNITRSGLVCRFFAPRKGDYEIEPDRFADPYRLSGGSQHSGTEPSQGASRQSSAEQFHQQHHAQNPYAGGYQNQPPHHQQAHHQRNQASQSYRSPNELQAPPPMLRNNSALTQASANSATSNTTMKIKVWFEEDNCVVIRMPVQFRYADLAKKLRERRALEQGGGSGTDTDDLFIEYRDEVEGQYYPIENDEDLAVAIDRNPKLNLTVSSDR